MSKLHVDASARWASGTAEFQRIPIMVVLSVTDDAGAPVTGLRANQVFTRYLQAPDHGSNATFEEAFREIRGGLPVAEGFYSYVVKPSEEAGGIWVQNQLFLFITVRRTGDTGQAVCLATYHRQ